ncbi:hypothetical protein [Desulfatitalea tepidiphila]|uniref:hypothetical protein n=1 Tax=Desulfatitalea tepidiphila TaxID=1185843 RepID=UPI00128EB7F5|nr:hypothetical protein [Desulfatitalea tepidiphila]
MTQKNLHRRNGAGIDRILMAGQPIGHLHELALGKKRGLGFFVQALDFPLVAGTGNQLYRPLVVACNITASIPFRKTISKGGQHA